MMLPIEKATEGISFYQEFGGWAISATLILLAYLFYRKIIIPVIKWWKEEREKFAKEFKARDKKLEEIEERSILAIERNNKYLRDIAKTLHDAGLEVKDTNGDQTILFERDKL